jgi:nucleoid-associated protein YgaU
MFGAIKDQHVAIASTNAFAIAGGVVAAGAIGAAAVWFSPQEPQSGVAPQVAALTTQTDVEPVAEAAPTAATALNQAIVMAPTIDTFFRSPDDTTVIAGQAAPGQVVAIMLGGVVIETVTAGADGAFGTVLFLEASDQPRRLRLIADPDGAAIASTESIIVPPSEAVVIATAPTETAPDAVTALALDSDPGQAPAIVSETNDQIAVASDVAGGVAPQIDSAPALNGSIGATNETSAAPPTLIADADGVRILQPDIGGSAQPTVVENIALDTITYDPDGEVLLAGRGASAGGFVRIYLDNQPITTSKITLQGDWRTDLPEVDTGIYTLRVDEVDAEGVVQSRIETPFKKELAEDVAAILAEETSADGFDIAVKTVQPGATLWAIAEEQLGDGILYVSVFDANRDLIRDPDLIYPGQVFRIPNAAQ